MKRSRSSCIAIRSSCCSCRVLFDGLSILFFLLVLCTSSDGLAQDADDLESASLPSGAHASSFIARCRATFPKAAENPSKRGGLKPIVQDGVHGICIYGSLENETPKTVEEKVAGGKFQVAILQSTGGPVPTWLKLGEILLPQVSTVIVDEACFSSCANFAFVLGKHRIVREGALVVWHGGPIADTENFESIVDASDTASSQRALSFKDYVELSERTKRLYSSLAIDVGLLKHTGKSDLSEEAIESARTLLGGKALPSLKGYALPPEILTACFGLRGLEEMWHPGSGIRTIEAGFSRSRELFIMDAPELIKSSPCAINYCRKSSARWRVILWIFHLPEESTDATNDGGMRCL